MATQRGVVLTYLQAQRVQHGQVGEWPAWHLDPYIAIWAIESSASPGRVGWWVISGDLPTDYVSSRDARHPREVMRHFARQWKEVSSYMLRGEVHPETKIGPPDQWPVLGDLLHRRAQLLEKFAADESLWTEDNS